MSRKEQDLMRDIKRRWAIKCEAGELICFLCGKKIDSMKQCNADHWIPRALGGKSTEENLKPSHVSCNSRKGCIPPEEFELHRDEILKGTYKKESKQETLADTIPKKAKKKKPADLGDTIYYIHKSSDKTTSKVEVKKGVVIGYAEDGCVLVKDFYANLYNKIESELIAVIPLSKKKALDLKFKCDEQMNQILQLQLQHIR